MRVLLVDLGTPRDEISEPLGIETLASYVEDEFSDQIMLNLKSLELDNLKSIEPYLVENYQVIGLSTKIRTYDRLKDSMEAIYRYSPDSIIVVGDILGTYAYDEVLKKYPMVICVRGEGENNFVELLRRELSPNNLSLTDIPESVEKPPKMSFRALARNPTRSVALSGAKGLIV